MTLELNEEQLMLKESVDNFITREYSFEQRRDALALDVPLRNDVWLQFAELGWLGAGISEEAGGFGGSAIEHMVICEGLGRAMALEPFISTAVIGAHALELADDRTRAQEIIAKLIAGEWRCALAYAEVGARYDLHHVTTSARTQGNVTVLNGEKLAVLDAPSATTLIVAARAEGGSRDAHGIGLYLVDTDATKLDVHAYQTVDGRHAANVRFADCPAQVLVAPERGLEVLTRIIERAIAARCAEASGAMDASFQQTLEYMKTREQFGVPIGSFQVIQHRLVDMLMRVKECQAAVLMVASEVMEDESDERAAAISAAKAFVGKRARDVGQEIVQLHGGVGMTEELSIGHFFRFLTQFCSNYGSTAHHLNRYSNASV